MRVRTTFYRQKNFSHFDQYVKKDMRSEKVVGRDVLASINDRQPRVDTYLCVYIPKDRTHRGNYRQKRAKNGKVGVIEDSTLAVKGADQAITTCEFSIGSSRPLVSDEGLFNDAMGCDSECVLPDADMHQVAYQHQVAINLVACF